MQQSKVVILQTHQQSSRCQYSLCTEAPVLRVSLISAYEVYSNVLAHFFPRSSSSAWPTYCLLYAPLSLCCAPDVRFWEVVELPICVVDGFQHVASIVSYIVFSYYTQALVSFLSPTTLPHFSNSCEFQQTPTKPYVKNSGSIVHTAENRRCSIIKWGSLYYCQRIHRHGGRTVGTH